MILKKNKTPKSLESLKGLPGLAKQLEISLYRDAPSLEAYKALPTLIHRLKQIAIEVSRKSSRSSSQGGDPHRQQPPPPPQQQQQQHNRQPQGMHNGIQSSVRRSEQAASPYGHNQMDGDSTIVRGNLTQGGHPPIHPSGTGVAPPLQPPPHYPDQRSNPSMGGRVGGAGGPGRRDETNALIRKKIRHKQERLLLLHHSETCPYEEGTCRVTRHCVTIKRLWPHMEGCTDKYCTVKHCYSSRYILSHFRKCKDKDCPACGPARDRLIRLGTTSKL
jgi:E1A/CREB-binding protein